MGGRRDAEPLRRPHRRLPDRPGRDAASERATGGSPGARPRRRSSSSASSSSTWSGSSTSRPSRRSPSGRRGCSSSCSTSSSSSPGSRTSRGAAPASTGRRSTVFLGGFVANAVYGIVQLGTAEVLGINLDQSLLSPITGGASQINIYGAIEGASVFRPNALTGDPNHLGIELVIPLLVLLPIYLRLERGHRLRVPLALVLAFLLVVELATLSRSGLLGLGAGLLVLAVPYRHKLLSPQLLLPLGAGRGDARHRPRRPLAVLRAGAPLAHRHLGERHVDAPRRLRLHPGRALVEPALRARPEQLLRLLRVRHRPDELRSALVLRRDARRDRRRRDGALRRLPRLHLQAARDGCARSAVRSARRGSGRWRGG